MEHLVLSPHMLVGDLLERFPGLAGLFVRRHLDCAGCSMTRFCTLEEVSAQYGLAFESLLQEMQEGLRFLGSDATFDE